MIVSFRVRIIWFMNFQWGTWRIILVSVMYRQYCWIKVKQLLVLEVNLSNWTPIVRESMQYK